MQKLLSVRIVVILALFAGCSPKEKSLDEVANEALAMSRNYKAANKLAEAESAIQDGLMKTKSPALMGAYVELLEQTQQWKKLEDYIEVNGAEMYAHQLRHAQTAVAANYFSAKNWERAANFSLKAAATDSAQRGTPIEKRSCPSVAPESIRNAVAAFFNARSKIAMTEARESLIALAGESRCANAVDQKELRRNLDDVDRMIREASLLK